MTGSRRHSSEPASPLFIGIGSNVGDAAENCRGAVRRIHMAEDIEVLQSSSLFRTEPVGYTQQDRFVNGVVKCSTRLEPLDLLRLLLRIEKEMGRKRSDIKWGPRVIDLDILFYGSLIMDRPDLLIPHPLIHERRFVLEPMAEIEPKFVHPVIGRTIEELLRALPDDGSVEKM